MSSAALDRHPLVDQLAEEMQRRHLTQRETAQELGVSYRTIQTWFSRGVPTPQPRHRRAIIAWLERGEDME
jgi:transcriptional regulator with XRE-family HTH domain